MEVKEKKPSTSANHATADLWYCFGSSFGMYTTLKGELPSYRDFVFRLSYTTQQQQQTPANTQQEGLARHLLPFRIPRFPHARAHPYAKPSTNFCER